MEKNEDSIAGRALWDNIQQNNIHIIGILEGENRKEKKKKIISGNNG